MLFELATASSFIISTLYLSTDIAEKIVKKHRYWRRKKFEKRLALDDAEFDILMKKVKSLTNSNTSVIYSIVEELYNSNYRLTFQQYAKVEDFVSDWAVNSLRKLVSHDIMRGLYEQDIKNNAKEFVEKLIG